MMTGILTLTVTLAATLTLTLTVTLAATHICECVVQLIVLFISQLHLSKLTNEQVTASFTKCYKAYLTVNNLFK